MEGIALYRSEKPGEPQAGRAKHKEAGKMLLGLVKHPLGQELKHRTLFYAATQFLIAGCIGVALRICRRVERRFLAPSDRANLDGFFRNLKKMHRRAEKARLKKIEEEKRKKAREAYDAGQILAKIVRK